MDRRKFVSKSTILGLGSLIILPSISNATSFKYASKRGFKNVLEEGYLKKSSIPGSYQAYIEQLKIGGFKNLSNQGLTYNGHLIISAEKSGLLFSKKGLIIITDNLFGKEHVFIEERFVSQLDELLYSYLEGVKSVGFKTDIANQLLPNKILKKGESNICYLSQSGQTLNFIHSNKKFKITLS